MRAVAQSCSSWGSRRLGMILALGLLGGCPSATTGAGTAPLAPADDQRAHVLLAASGVKGAALDASQRGRLLALADQTRCPCDKRRGSLAECAPTNSCVRAPFALRAIIRSLQRRNIPDAAITGQLLERFGPREPEQVDLTLAHCRGAKTAPVTLVLFSDFQCPYCNLARKMLSKLEHDFGRAKLRTCFFSLVVHKEARLAALAGVAAQLQGKFWPYHDKLFDNMRAQTRDDLVSYAREVGLDRARFERDLDGDMVKVRLLRHETIANKLKLQSTPSFFVNGRPVVGPKSLATFRDWIEEALAMHAAKGQPTKPAATQPAVKATEPTGKTPAD
jgi:predicted DsbA family dithiol-disulfide isomerase